VGGEIGGFCRGFPLQPGSGAGRRAKFYRGLLMMAAALSPGTRGERARRTRNPHPTIPGTRPPNPGPRPRMAGFTAVRAFASRPRAGNGLRTLEGGLRASLARDRRALAGQS